MPSQCGIFISKMFTLGVTELLQFKVNKNYLLPIKKTRLFFLVMFIVPEPLSFFLEEGDSKAQ